MRLKTQRLNSSKWNDALLYKQSLSIFLTMDWFYGATKIHKVHKNKIYSCAELEEAWSLFFFFLCKLSALIVLVLAGQRVRMSSPASIRQTCMSWCAADLQTAPFKLLKPLQLFPHRRSTAHLHLSSYFHATVDACSTLTQGDTFFYYPWRNVNLKFKWNLM